MQFWLDPASSSLGKSSVVSKEISLVSYDTQDMLHGQYLGDLASSVTIYGTTNTQNSFLAEYRLCLKGGKMDSKGDGKISPFLSSTK